MPERKQRFINPLLQPSAPVQPEIDQDVTPEPVEELPDSRLAERVRQAEAVHEEEKPKAQMYRTTIYLSKADLLLLDRYRAEHFERTGNRMDRSELIRKAIKLYAEQHERE